MPRKRKTLPKCYLGMQLRTYEITWQKFYIFCTQLYQMSQICLVKIACTVEMRVSVLLSYNRSGP